MVSFGEIFSKGFVFPIQECLKMLTDQRIADYLGFTVLAIPVTGLCILVVANALLSPVRIPIPRKIKSDSKAETDAKGSDKGE